MNRQEREYRRLPGRGTKRGGFISITRVRAALWAGKDHLLSVFSTGYTEEYKRFYYRDIQAIVMRKTGRGTVWSIVSGLFFLFFGALAATATTTVLAAVWWTPAGLAALFLTVNVLRGPTCICHLQTAVSREELPSLGRERAAKKTLDLLNPLIEAAQGVLSREEMTAGWEDLSRRAPAVSLPPGEHAGAAVSTYRGNVHEALFYLLLLDGIMNAANIFVHGPAMGIAGTLLWIVAGIVTIVALVKQQGGLTKSIRSITWAALSYMITVLFLGYVTFIYAVIKNPDALNAARTQWQMFKMMSSITPAENPVLMFTLYLSVACAAPLGTAGLILLRKFRREHDPVPVTHAAPGEGSALSGSTER